MHKKTITTFIILALGLLAVTIWWCTRPQHFTKTKTFTVQSTPVKIETVPIFWTSIGTIAAQQTVTVLPQITGTINKISFQEGQWVNAGDALLTIDPTPFQLNLDNANAVLKKDQATLDALTGTVQRDKTLFKTNLVAPQDYETAVANMKAQEAMVAADQSQISLAENQLSYTKVTAPISGKTGNLNVKIGDVVSANTSVLTTINQMNPILVNFSISQNQLATLLKYQAQSPIKVTVSTDKNHSFSGVLNFINNTVDPLSGTIAVKALIQNPDHLLWPGAVVTVHLTLTTIPNALVIPASALQIDDQGSFVFVNDQGTAKILRVILGEKLDDQIVVTKGLQPTSILLTNIPPNLKDGTKVIIAS